MEDTRLAEQRECQDRIEELVEEVFTCIQDDSLQRVNQSMKVLNTVHQQFLSQFLGFSDQLASEEERSLSEKILSRVTAVRETLA